MLRLPRVGNVPKMDGLAFVNPRNHRWLPLPESSAGVDAPAVAMPAETITAFMKGSIREGLVSLAFLGCIVLVWIDSLQEAAFV